jgi:hypothetical protein
MARQTVPVWRIGAGWGISRLDDPDMARTIISTENINKVELRCRLALGAEAAGRRR